jgi:hypothetical protein
MATRSYSNSCHWHYALASRDASGSLPRCFRFISWICFSTMRTALSNQTGSWLSPSPAPREPPAHTSPAPTPSAGKAVAVAEFMSEDLTQTTLATWAARNLPARLDVTATAKLLGFAEHDIQILMAVGKLTPLGDPAPNAPKWFAAVEIIQLAADRDWLHKATKEISKYWRQKRERRLNSQPSLAMR